MAGASRREYLGLVRTLFACGRFALVVLAPLTGCGTADTGADRPPRQHPDTGDTGADPDPVPASQDVISTDLHLDLKSLKGHAVVTVVTAGDADAIHLKVGDLVISTVKLDGADAEYTVIDDRIKVPAAAGSHELDVNYSFSAHEEWAGWMPKEGLTFDWPYFCGNLFPCNPDTADGLTFTFDVTGYADEMTAVYPTEIAAEAPPYMLAVAVADFTETDLGTTTAGTDVSLWTLPGGLDNGLQGTKNLVAGFDFLEQTYGPYSFGDHVGTVEAAWSDLGGMEHHPYWHSSTESMRSEEVHIHEAAHGWYGDGVRLECWEDLTLSEGTTSYIAGRALAESGGPDLFETYIEELDYLCADGSPANTIAMPTTCGAIDILEDPLWSMVPYMKGACFYEDVSHVIGTEALDLILADFYQQHVGGAARMGDMVEFIRAEVPAEQMAAYDDAVKVWLEDLACPSDYAERCTAG